MEMSDLTMIFEKCNREGIPSYTELILGLPLETFETWKTGLCEIIKAGQHNAIESWFSQFKHYYKQDEISVNFNDVQRNVTKSIRKIKLENYRNYMKYAYKTQEESVHDVLCRVTKKKNTKDEDKFDVISKEELEKLLQLFNKEELINKETYKN